VIESIDRLPGASVFPLRTDADFERPQCNCDPGFSFAACPVHAPEPHQHTIVEDYVREWKPIIAGFDNATVNRLINVIESIKLHRAIERRAELDQLIMRARGDLDALRGEWDKVQGGIVQMIYRGVQP